MVSKIRCMRQAVYLARLASADSSRATTRAIELGDVMKHFVVAITALAALAASTASCPKGDITKITPCNKYVVLYQVDEDGVGYVYLPRWDEEIGRCNMSLIARDVEGNWFRSSQAWDDVA